MSDPAKPRPVFLINNKSAQKSKLWGDTAKNRFIKQHGSVEDIPEGDAHSIPVYNSPVETVPASPTEKKAAEDKLEKEISILKNKSNPTQQQTPLPSEPKGNNFYDEWID